MIQRIERNIKREGEFRDGFKSPNLLVKSKWHVSVHALSNNSTSKDIIVHDSESNPDAVIARYSNERKSNFDITYESRSSTSSTRANSPSCIFNLWQDEDDDLKTAMACPLNVKSLKPSEINSDTEWLRRPIAQGCIEVIAHGTRLMATILFPTVIVKMTKKRLDHSTLYYVILDPSSRAYFKKIVCVMFSSPVNSESTFQTAELLPLHPVKSSISRDGISLIPMLLNQYYRPIFEIGCKFKVTTIHKGRRMNRKGRKWRDYDMGKSWIHLLLRRLICLDINEIPRIFNALWSSLVEEHLLDNSILAKTKSNHDCQLEIDLCSDTDSNINTNLSSCRKPVRRKLSFGKFYNLLPPQTREKKIHEGKHIARPRNDEFGYALNEYTSLSDKV